MKMKSSPLRFMAVATVVSSASLVSGNIGTSTFTVPGAFPTSLFSQYYNSPTATSAQAQPVISDPVLVSSKGLFLLVYFLIIYNKHKVYPDSLTNPDTIPPVDTVDAHPLPPKASPQRIYSEAFSQVLSIASNPIFGNDTCGRCLAGLEAAKFLALAAPQEGPTLAVALCKQFNFSPTCEQTYGEFGLGSTITQVVSNANVGGLDGQVSVYNILWDLQSLTRTLWE
jgi:sphingomyelin phosphodiesterase